MSELYKSQSVADCTVLITGATAGIGEAIAWRFAEAGAKLIICGRRTERLEALSAALVAKYPALTPPHLVTLDVQQLDKLQALPAELPEAFREHRVQEVTPTYWPNGVSVQGFTN